MVIAETDVKMRPEQGPILEMSRGELLISAATVIQAWGHRRRREKFAERGLICGVHDGEGEG